jgi:hypothetical protein
MQPLIHVFTFKTFEGDFKIGLKLNEDEATIEMVKQAVLAKINKPCIINTPLPNDAKLKLLRDRQIRAGKNSEPIMSFSLSTYIANFSFKTPSINNKGSIGKL